MPGQPGQVGRGGGIDLVPEAIGAQHGIRGAEDGVAVDVGTVSRAAAGAGRADGAPRARDVEFRGHNGRADSRHAQVDAARQGGDVAEQVGVELGVVQGAVAAHRQADDGPVGLVGDGAQIGVDEGHHLRDVEGLPVRRAQGGVLHGPVGVPALQTAVRHHGDHGVGVQAVSYTHHKRQVGGVSAGEEDADLVPAGQLWGGHRDSEVGCGVHLAGACHLGQAVAVGEARDRRSVGVRDRCGEHGQRRGHRSRGGGRLGPDKRPGQQ